MPNSIEYPSGSMMNANIMPYTPNARSSSYTRCIGRPITV